MIQLKKNTLLGFVYKILRKRKFIRVLNHTLVKLQLYRQKLCNPSTKNENVFVSGTRKPHAKQQQQKTHASVPIYEYAKRNIIAENYAKRLTAKDPASLVLTFKYVWFAAIN